MKSKEEKLKLKSIKILKILTKYGKELDKYNIPYKIIFENKTSWEEELKENNNVENNR